MTEIELEELVPANNQNFHIDLLYEIYLLKKQREQLISKLKSFRKLLNSGCSSNFKYKFEALKVVIAENETRYRNLNSKVNGERNLFTLNTNFEQTKGFLRNLEKERKKGRIELSDYEITKGYYLQKMLDFETNLSHLQTDALSYIDILKDKLINLEDQRIVLTTEKLRKTISKEDFREKIDKLSKEKQELEENYYLYSLHLINNFTKDLFPTSTNHKTILHQNLTLNFYRVVQKFTVIEKNHCGNCCNSKALAKWTVKI